MGFSVECYGASRPQQGRTANEDAFWIGREPFPVAVVCDGAGNAQQSAQRAITFFQKLWASATPDQIRAADTWGKWIYLLDSHLDGIVSIHIYWDGSHGRLFSRCICRRQPCVPFHIGWEATASHRQHA